MRKTILLLVLVILISSSALAISNPSAKLCVELGNSYEVRTDSEGNEYGTCITNDDEEIGRASCRERVS